MKTTITNKLSTPVFAVLALILFGSTTINAGPGDLDTSFGTGGRVPAPSGLPAQAAAFGVAVQPDEKILVGGREQDFSGGTSSGLQRLILTRYLPNGSLDLTFGEGGRVVTALSEQCPSHGNDLVLQDDGKIVVTGNLDGCGQESGAYALRFLPNGSLDPIFDGDGKLRITTINAACTLAIQRDGKLVFSCGGFIVNEGPWSAILRHNPNGSIDTTFDAGLGAGYDSGVDIAIQPDGKIIAAETIILNAHASIMLSRLNSDGSLDASFGNSGQVVTSGAEVHFFARAIALQPDNKIVVACDYQSDSAYAGQVTRYLPDGSLDTSFGESGMILGIGGSGTYLSLAIQSNGKIVAGGWSSSGHILARFLSNGAPDQTFGTNGRILTVFPNLSQEGIVLGSIADLAIQSDGNIIGAGYWFARPLVSPFDPIWSYPAIARYVGDAVPIAKVPFDFDGDGRSDISVFRPSDRVWYLNLSTAGFSATQFGLSTDKIAPADYDGDGKTDISIFRDGVWWRVNSSNNTVAAVEYGQTGDIPVAADYTGDGRDELVVYRNGQWWALDLSNNQSSLVNFGLATDKPVPADYDGDGRVDQAVYRNGEWHIYRSTLGQTVALFGLASDRPVAGDYDGDAKADLAVYRDGTWYLLQSTAGFTAFQWGLSTDIPAPADYDGDGRSDAAVFRNGTWHLRQSTSGFAARQFGLAADQPVPAAYLR